MTIRYITHRQTVMTLPRSSTYARACISIDRVLCTFDVVACACPKRAHCERSNDQMTNKEEAWATAARLAQKKGQAGDAVPFVHGDNVRWGRCAGDNQGPLEVDLSPESADIMLLNDSS